MPPCQVLAIQLRLSLSLSVGMIWATLPMMQPLARLWPGRQCCMQVGPSAWQPPAEAEQAWSQGPSNDAGPWGSVTEELAIRQVCHFHVRLLAQQWCRTWPEHPSIRLASTPQIHATRAKLFAALPVCCALHGHCSFYIAAIFLSLPNRGLAIKREPDCRMFSTAVPL